MTSPEEMGPPGTAEGPEVACTANASPGPVPVAGEARARKKGPYPPESVKVLRDWLLEHGHQRHLSKAEKRLLSQQTGLSTRQIYKWLSRSRRRELRRKLQDGDGGKLQDGDGGNLQDGDGGKLEDGDGGNVHDSDGPKLEDGDRPQQVAAGHHEDGAAPATQPENSEATAQPEAQPRGPERQYLPPQPPLMAQEAWGHLLYPNFTPARRLTVTIHVTHTITVYTIRPLWLLYPVEVRMEQGAEFHNLHVLADAATQRAGEEQQEQQEQRGAHH